MNDIKEFKQYFCAQCKRNFVKNSWQQIYCSKSCKNKNFRQSHSEYFKEYFKKWKKSHSEYFKEYFKKHGKSYYKIFIERHPLYWKDKYKMLKKLKKHE